MIWAGETGWIESYIELVTEATIIAFINSKNEWRMRKKNGGNKKRESGGGDTGAIERNRRVK